MRTSNLHQKPEKIKTEPRRNYSIFALVVVVICQSCFILLNWLYSAPDGTRLVKSDSAIKLKYEDIKSNGSVQKQISNSSVEYLSPSFEGVAVTTFLGSPKWFQNRYSMMINNVHGILPKLWAIQIVHNDKKMALEGINYPGLRRYANRNQLILTPLPPEMKKMKKKEILTTLWFWKSLVADRVLMFGGSGIFCANAPVDLLSFHLFDYIGTPWNEFQGRGGDGGMSLRRRHQMIQVINRALAVEMSDGPGPTIGASPNPSIVYQSVPVGKEDSFFVKSLLQNASITVATPGDTTRFAMNDVRAIGQPLAAQGVLGGLNESIRIQFIEYCPEMKIFFPVLQSPDCFGASPHAASCFQSLCQFGGLKCNVNEEHVWTNKAGKQVKLSISLAT